MEGAVIAGITIGAVVFLLFLTFLNFTIGLLPQIVGPDEMAIYVFLGEPKDFRDSGFYLIPLFFGTKLERFPKRMYDLDYPARDVITKEGKYPLRGKQSRAYGAQTLKVTSVAYVTFPQFFERTTPEKVKIGLAQILRKQVPTDREGLKDFTEEAVIGAVRVAMGGMTWREAVENIENVKERAEEVFRSADGALIRAGFNPDPDDLRLTIEEIKLPRELEAALPAPDKARLDAEAAGFVAKTRAIETVGTVVEMMARSRGQTPEAIQVLIAADADAQREFLDLSKDLIRRRMAIDGKSFVDIRVEGAEGIEKTLLDLLAAWQRMPGGGAAPAQKPRRTRTVRNLGMEFEVPEEEEEM